MAKVMVEIEIEDRADLPEFERAEWRKPTTGEYYFGCDGDIYRAVQPSNPHRVVLIPKVQWIDATPQHVGDQIAGRENYRWRYSSDGKDWVERSPCLGFDSSESRPFCRAYGQWHSYAQVLKT